MSAKPSLHQRLRSRSVVALVHLGLWVLLVLAVMGLGGRSSRYSELRSQSPPPQSFVPIARLEHLFAGNPWPKVPADTNSLDPFFTRHFNPEHPAAAPPTTRDIDLTYLGYFQAGDGPKQAMLKLEKVLLPPCPVGSNITANLYAADALIDSLTLTNPARQTNLLRLNVKTRLTVPLR